MPAASRDALAKLRAYQNAGGATSATALTSLADDLFAVVDVLVGSPSLRRALGDPATDPEGRAGLAARIFGGQVGQPAVALLQAAVRERWSSPWDLTDALELTANDTLFAAAESEHHLGDVEDELFRFERILDQESALTTLLDEQTVPIERRLALLDQVVATKVRPITKSLLEHAVASTRTRGLTFAVRGLLDEAAARRAGSIARVLSAIELTAEQQSRLAAALSGIYGRTITVKTAVDPTLIGGLVVQVGDELIDGSVAARLTAVRASLAV